jgi:hypothetical protein
MYFQAIVQKKQRKVRGSAIPICATKGSEQIGDEACHYDRSKILKQ